MKANIVDAVETPEGYDITFVIDDKEKYTRQFPFNVTPEEVFEFITKFMNDKVANATKKETFKTAILNQIIEV